MKGLIIKKGHKKIAAILILAAMTLAFTACGKYTSHYVTTTMVQSHDSDSISVSFGTLKGTLAYTLSCDDSSDKLEYSCKIESGSATVYYDNDGTKTELFTLNGNDKASSTLEGLKKGDLYIIIETDGKCEEGSFDFELK